ncbi:vitamin K epoxide reductase family protein [Phycicoccus sp. HDW14]|uniref:vitamin K epoxide reductase family protein n=1 Tax=Phycicoccus sp. HDW14 TaxID=2714941 RepID=UPI00140A80CC|nr:vitamin K epoxide reductase family protein [Phycicoccus sp. HDW14]QIM22856.1 vitamin K epoxide reductase family protein [Phycicoccus sp. HDW14]
MSDTTIDSGRSGPDDVDDVDELDDDDLLPPGRLHSRGFVFGEMLLFAVLSLIASFVLSVDAIKIAENPDVILSCSINPILDCARVGASWQAHVLGFPNAFLGLIAEPVVMTIAVASLAGTRFPRWFMGTANVVYFLGVVFAYWLLYQSTFSIGALCPWCLLVTVSTTFVFVSMTHWNVLHDNLYLPARVQAWAHGVVVKGYLMAGLVIWLTLVFALELLKWGPAILRAG